VQVATQFAVTRTAWIFAAAHCAIQLAKPKNANTNSMHSCWSLSVCHCVHFIEVKSNNDEHRATGVILCSVGICDGKYR